MPPGQLRLRGRNSWALVVMPSTMTLRRFSSPLMSARAVSRACSSVACGGMGVFVRGAALAAAHNLQVSAHCAPSLHAHVGAAVPNLRHVEYFQSGR